MSRIIRHFLSSCLVGPLLLFFCFQGSYTMANSLTGGSGIRLVQCWHDLNRSDADNNGCLDATEYMEFSKSFVEQTDHYYFTPNVNDVVTVETAVFWQQAFDNVVAVCPEEPTWDNCTASNNDCIPLEPQPPTASLTNDKNNADLHLFYICWETQKYALQHEFMMQTKNEDNNNNDGGSQSQVVAVESVRLQPCWNAIYSSDMDQNGCLAVDEYLEFSRHHSSDNNSTTAKDPTTSVDDDDDNNSMKTILSATDFWQQTFDSLVAVCPNEPTWDNCTDTNQQCLPYLPEPPTAQITNSAYLHLFYICWATQTAALQYQAMLQDLITTPEQQQPSAPPIAPSAAPSPLAVTPSPTINIRRPSKPTEGNNVDILKSSSKSIRTPQFYYYCFGGMLLFLLTF